MLDLSFDFILTYFPAPRKFHFSILKASPMITDRRLLDLSIKGHKIIRERLRISCK
jgi:hypothetical protein